MRDDEIFYMGTSPFRIDIFRTQGDLSFDEAWRKRVKDKFFDIDTYFVSREDLLRLKKFAGRVQDLEDIKKLNKKREEKS